MAVTGGTGFVGGAVIRAALEAGWEVHSYGRREVPGTVFHPWDALEPSSDDDSVRKFDAVIHCAASATDWGSDFEIVRTNLRGTRKALDIDRHARFVHVSTASVYGSKNRLGSMLREDAPRAHDFLNAYSRSKADAEHTVLLDERDSGAIILRPHAIYGPGDTTLLPRVEKAVRMGRLLLPNGGWNLASLTRIDNLVQVIMEMAVLASPDHRVYNVADGVPVTMRIALKSILGNRGIPVKIVDLSANTAWRLGRAAEWFYRELETTKAPPITRYMVSQLGYEQTLNLQRIEAQLGRKMPSSDFSDAASWNNGSIL